MSVENQVFVPFQTNSDMTDIFTVAGGPTIKGAWSRDIGTMETRLRLVVVYSDGEFSPIREYDKSKLVNEKALRDLADLDGISSQCLKDIYKAIVKKQRSLAVQADGNGKCSLRYAYQALCEYVQGYEEPRQVFIRDGYGNILASYLQSVLDRLELGYTRMELQKNFKVWGLLRTSDPAGHMYSYGIKVGARMAMSLS